MLTLDDVTTLTNKGYDPFVMPDLASMMVLNVTHHEIPTLVKPSRAEIEALDTDVLPQRALLDPQAYRGARCGPVVLCSLILYWLFSPVLVI